MKIIFFDIDGTLLDYDGRMPQSTREALALAKEKVSFVEPLRK